MTERYVMTRTDASGHWIMATYRRGEIARMWEDAETSCDRDGLADLRITRCCGEDLVELLPGCPDRPRVEAHVSVEVAASVSGPLFGLSEPPPQSPLGKRLCEFAANLARGLAAGLADARSEA